MNAEQLKQLKRGDEIFIRARYKTVLGDGDVLFSHSALSAYDKVTEENAYTHPQNVILPSELQPPPKYDPCRLFRAGDRVTPKVVNGRDFNNIAEEMKGKVLIVTQDENRLCNVYVRDGEDEFTIDPAYLELVTPVEELEPYYIGTWENMLAVYKKTQTEDIIISMFSQSHPHAKEAAEAECKRLNEEYRKEANNGLGH